MTRRVDLDATPDAPAHAREFTRTQLRDILEPVPELADVISDAVLVVSELVSNAVKASAAPIAFALHAHHAWLGVTVHDADPEPPVLLDPEPAETHGRGLRIVAVLTDAWGVHPDPAGGKTVWARLPLPEAATKRLGCRHPDVRRWPH